MKKTFTITAIILSVAILMLTCISVSAVGSMETNNGVLDYAAQVITSQYKDYYTIHNIDVDILDTVKNGDMIEYYAVIDFNRRLLADEATDLPYVVGCVDTLQALENGIDAENTVASNYVANLINELENEYIGELQNTSVYVYVTSPVNFSLSTPYESQVEVLVENMLGEKVSPSVLAPASAEAMYANGQTAINQIVSSATTMTMNNTVNTNIQEYDRVAARNYAREWSCDSGSYVSHSGCHNTAYTFYEGAYGSDCANFVSQCFYAGGLPTDTTWYKDSLAWVRGAGICDYVEDNNLFFQTDDEMRAFAGSIIRWSANHHVGLVDQNDTVNMTFCAHSACRNSCPWGGEDVYFFVPYWDSYSNAWVTN